MSTPAQTNYISDLTVLKTKEFKEVKELLVSHNIVSADSSTVMDAGTVAEICNALTDYQASQLIDALVAVKAPDRGRQYAQNRIKKTIATLDSVKSTIADWTF